MGGPVTRLTVLTTPEMPAKHGAAGARRVQSGEVEPSALYRLP